MKKHCKFHNILFISILTLINGCNTKPSGNEFVVKRCDIALMNVDTSHFNEEIISLADDFPVFFGKAKHDTSGMADLFNFATDSVIRKVGNDCEKAYPANYKFNDLLNALHNVQTNVDTFNLKSIYTYISGLDFEYPAIYNDTTLIIAIDMYLGSDYPIYNSPILPKYKVNRFDEDYMARDCLLQIAEKFNIEQAECTKLIDFMIYHGKNLKFAETNLDNTKQSTLLGFTEPQMEWCKENEKFVWEYLVTNDILFSSDSQIIRRFIDDGPFTSIFSREAPAMLGRWIGYNIVDSYCRHNHVDIFDIMNDGDAQKIFMQSRYRANNGK